MALKFCILELVLGYLPLTSPGLSQKTEKSRKIEIVDQDFENFFDYSNFTSFYSPSNADSKYINFFTHNSFIKEIVAVKKNKLLKKITKEITKESKKV